MIRNLLSVRELWNEHGEASEGSEYIQSCMLRVMFVYVCMQGL
jgi:hypothetical protein